MRARPQFPSPQRGEDTHRAAMEGEGTRRFHRPTTSERDSALTFPMLRMGAPSSPHRGEENLRAAAL